MKKAREKIIASNLLTSYSTKSITTIFKNIDSRIFSLIKCSSDDFLYLNQKFKNLYKQIGLISENTRDILLFVCKEDTKLFINEISSVLDKYRNILSQIENQIIESQSILEDLIKHFDLLYIPVNNCNQDLRTLKLLTINLKFDPSTVHYANQFNNKLNNILIILPQLLNDLQFLRLNINKLNSTFQNIKNNQIFKIHEVIDTFNQLSHFLTEKYHDANKLIPTLEKRTKESQEGASEIIKNLQYQDIVKQKIEHVQLTHNDIINRLQELNRSAKTPDFLLIKAKLFLQIRDVAGLQAAQLIHANKKYQQALGIIMKSFSDLNEVLMEITNIGDDFLKSNNKNKAQKLLNRDFIINSFSELSTEFESTINFFQLNIMTTVKNIKSYISNYKELKSNFSLFKNFAEEVLGKDNNKSYDIFNQIKTVTHALLTTLEHIDKNLQDVTKLTKNIETKATEEFIKLKIEKQYDSVSLKLKTLLNDFIDNTIKSLLQSRFDKADFNELSINMKKSIEDVKYYQFFEKEIEKIITELNTVSETLELGEEALEENEKEVFEKIKKRYSMKSEHEIHKLKIENDKYNVKVENANIDNEDDNIEFF